MPLLSYVLHPLAMPLPPVLKIEDQSLRTPSLQAYNKIDQHKVSSGGAKGVQGAMAPHLRLPLGPHLTFNDIKQNSVYE